MHFTFENATFETFNLTIDVTVDWASRKLFYVGENNENRKNYKGQKLIKFLPHSEWAFEYFACKKKLVIFERFFQTTLHLVHILANLNFKKFIVFVDFDAVDHVFSTCFVRQKIECFYSLEFLMLGCPHLCCAQCFSFEKLSWNYQQFFSRLDQLSLSFSNCLSLL